MTEQELLELLRKTSASAWRIRLAQWVESQAVTRFIIGVIVFNAIILGLETSAPIVAEFGGFLTAFDRLCLGVFTAEILLKLAAYRFHFFRSGWNLFDFGIVAIALVPATGSLAVLRSLRILRVLRLLTVLPQLQRVVAAFLQSIPGLSGVMLIMATFFYTMAVLATNLFGQAFPEWFGSIGKSLYSLFQIMTLESWSMGIVRPVMEVLPWAWMFFIPFIVIATFTILNLFIGIIVSTMQEMNEIAISPQDKDDLEETLQRISDDLEALKKGLKQRNNGGR